MARRKQDIELTPGIPKTFLELAHPTLTTRLPIGPDWIHEIKFDGYRMQLNIRDGQATWFTRNGHDYTDKLPQHNRDAAVFEDCILDGELCALDAEGQPSFSTLRSNLNPKTSGRLVYFVFDILWRGTTDLRPYALATRKKSLRKVLDDAQASHRFRFVDHFPDADADGLLKAACRMRLEGIVSKRLSENYRPGRTAVWMKGKCRPSQEVVIGGWKSGSDGRFKGLLTGVYDSGQLRYAGSLKTGFADRSLREIAPKLKALARPKSPFRGEQPRATGGDSLHFVEPRLVAQADIAEWTSSGRLRQASFKGLRDDKAPEEVRREL